MNDAYNIVSEYLTNRDLINLASTSRDVRNVVQRYINLCDNIDDIIFNVNREGILESFLLNLQGDEDGSLRRCLNDNMYRIMENIEDPNLISVLEEYGFLKEGYNKYINASRGLVRYLYDKGIKRDALTPYLIHVEDILDRDLRSGGKSIRFLDLNINLLNVLSFIVYLNHHNDIVDIMRIADDMFSSRGTLKYLLLLEVLAERYPTVYNSVIRRIFSGHHIPDTLQRYFDGNLEMGYESIDVYDDTIMQLLSYYTPLPEAIVFAHANGYIDDAEYETLVKHHLRKQNSTLTELLGLKYMLEYKLIDTDDPLLLKLQDMLIKF
ncbi:hypothetical protein D3C87_1228250 [compost metagenome]